MTNARVAVSRRAVWIIVGPDGRPRNIDYDGLCEVYPSQALADGHARQIDRVVRYVPAPTKRKRRRGK